MATLRRDWVPILRKKGKSPAQIEQFLDKCWQCEVQRHIASRRVTAPEAIWRLNGNEVTYQYPPVLRLDVHLEGEQCVFLEEPDLLKSTSVTERKAAQKQLDHARNTK